MFYVFPRAVAPNICDEIVKDCKQNTLEKAVVADYGHLTEAVALEDSRYDPNIRKNSVYFIADKDNAINELAWHFLREANRIQFNYNLDHFQVIQFAEYNKGEFFNWHQDDAGVSDRNEIRKLSLSLVLSDPNTFEGGELQFFNGDRPMQDMGEITGEQVRKDIQAQGSVIVFDSRDFHRVTPVTNGTRHSIVCWCVGGNFK